MRMKVLTHAFFTKRSRIILIFSLSLLLNPFQSIPAYAASPPSPPQYVEAMADVNQVAITWDAPGNNGGESNLNYTARIWSLPPPTNSAAIASCSTTQLGCIIGGLISGTVYYVDVIASNSAGAGAPSLKIQVQSRFIAWLFLLYLLAKRAQVQKYLELLLRVRKKK